MDAQVEVSYVTRLTLHATSHTSHVARHASHVTCRTSHIKRSHHVTRDMQRRLRSLTTDAAETARFVVRGLRSFICGLRFAVFVMFDVSGVK